MAHVALLFMLWICGVTAYFAYLSWRRPEVLRKHISRYARMYDGWNSAQAEWMRSDVFLKIVRAGATGAFIVMIALCALAVLGFLRT
jgi:hypothetical protein